VMHMCCVDLLVVCMWLFRFNISVNGDATSNSIHLVDMCTPHRMLAWAGIPDNSFETDDLNSPQVYVTLCALACSPRLQACQASFETMPSRAYNSVA